MREKKMPMLMLDTHVQARFGNGRKTWISHKYIQHQLRAAGTEYQIAAFCSHCGLTLISELDSSEGYCSLCQEVRPLTTMSQLANMIPDLKGSKKCQ